MTKMKDPTVIYDTKLALQGYAIGYQILEGGKVVHEHTYETPVKNLVVTAGKDFLCNSQQSNGLQVATKYLARGSDSTPAAAGNTTLGAQIGNRTNSYLSGNPFTGVKYTAATGLIQARRTYDSEVESGNQNINEIGLFGNAYGTDMFSRIVLPSTVTVLTGQQLRLTYELQITVGPITATVSSPTITGWTTTGEKRLEGTFPTTADYGSSTNQFLSLWGTTGADVGITAGDFLCPAYPSTFNYSTGWCFEWFTAKTFNTFGNVYYPTGTVYISNGSNQPNSDSGSGTCTLEAYTPGTFYRDLTVVAQPNYPSGLDAPAIKAIRCRGLTHIFDATVSKLNTQRLTLVFRVSVA